LLHLGIAALILWLMHESKITPKAINRQKITLELNQIQTLPPKPPGARPTPKVPPKPRPRPVAKPRPAPKPRPVPKPTPKPQPKPAPKKAEAPKEPRKKTAKGEARKNPLIADANRTKIQSDVTADKKVIVMKITPKQKREKPKKRQEPKKPLEKHIAKKPVPPRKTVKTAPRRTAKPTRQAVRRRPPSRPTPRGPDSRLIRSLYGSSYSRMSAVQRRFIDENLRRILQISQRTLNYLGYPREAARFGEQGTNVVEFWLHPNGDISGLRLRRRLNSSSLNRQTIEVIKTAYMHYPRPKVKTKIIIYVRYRMY
jgi:TonB family protein